MFFLGGKGGLISESFFSLGSHLQINVPYDSSESFALKQMCSGCDLARLFGDLNQSEKVSEIKRSIVE